jgi:hypothetical protein
MSRPPALPSDRREGLAFVVPDDWTPQQALAVFELIDDLREGICSRCQTDVQHAYTTNASHLSGPSQVRHRPDSRPASTNETVNESDSSHEAAPSRWPILPL